MKRLSFFIVIIFVTACACSLKKKTIFIRDLPIVYSDMYNIRIFGIQKFHPFDSEKYEKVYNYLTRTVGIDKKSFVIPEAISTNDLLLVHSEEYLASLKDSKIIAQVAELGLLKIFSASTLEKKLLQPMKFAVGGTIAGAHLALKKGWAINLSGGYHHAKFNKGEGFCFYADIPLAVKKVWERNESLKVLIIDLDAHQGNGIESFFHDEPRVHVIDVYNSEVYPRDVKEIKFINTDLPLKSNTSDKAYLSILKKHIPMVIKKFKPGLIIYNAGTDILKGDSLGQLKVSADGIIKRDEIVFENAALNKVPILMVLSGGYSSRSGKIIGRSIENILKKVIKIDLQ